MNPSKPTFLFDENLGKPMVFQLRRLLEMAGDDESADVIHLFEFFDRIGKAQNQAVKDSDWIPELRTFPCVVVSSDNGRGKATGGKLPKLCAELGVTHVILSASITHRKQFSKLLTILSLWHELLEAISLNPRGTKFAIEPLSQSFKHKGRGKLIRKSIPQPPDKQQKDLFE